MTAGQQIIETALRSRFGFLTADNLAAVAADPSTRLYPILVRCNGCRFSAPAQDVAHLIALVEANGREYVRDVSAIGGRS